MNKVKQFSVHDGYLVVLCEDGSIWSQVEVSGSIQWDKVPPIPEDDAQEQQSDIIDANTQEPRKPVSNNFHIDLVLELNNSGLCNILSELSALVYSQAELSAREREGELIISRAEAEDCPEYQNLELQYEMLVNLAEAVDIHDGADRFVREDKLEKLINKLENIQVA